VTSSHIVCMGGGAYLQSGESKYPICEPHVAQTYYSYYVMAAAANFLDTQNVYN